MSKKAVHIGAGNIGRGFIGQLYYESGYHTTFIDVMDSVVEAIQHFKEYPIDLVTNDTVERIQVRNIDAVHGKDLEAASSILAEADMASTAVGLNAMKHIAPLLARAVEKRFAAPEAAPLDIILCENINEGKSLVRKLVLAQLDPAFHAMFEQKVGLVEASIGRMVPIMPPEKLKEEPLLVCVEPYCELPVDAEGFKGAIPAIKNLKPASNFAAYVERKLYVHNMTHACAAYLGFQKGYTYIYEAIRDSTIRNIVMKAGRECCQALATKHRLNLDELCAYTDDLIERYQNKALADQIMRVARDPLRKLAPGDRLIGAAQLCAEHGVPPQFVSLGIAAALKYRTDDPDDPSAALLHEKLESLGLNGFLKKCCQVPPDSSHGRWICKSHEALRDYL